MSPSIFHQATFLRGNRSGYLVGTNQGRMQTGDLPILEIPNHLLAAGTLRLSRLNLCSFQQKQGKYLAFLGRIAPEKRLDRAIAIAQKTGIPLKIAAKVDKADQQYFVDEIEPLLNHPLVEFIGEIGEEEKNDFLGNALALLFPIDWPEPFGLVMIESFATGIPIIAFANGSVPEIIEHGGRALSWRIWKRLVARSAKSRRSACRGAGRILKHALESDGWPVNTSPFMKNFWPTAKRRAVMIFDLIGRLPDGVRVPCWI